jgi:hypothetical protein
MIQLILYPAKVARIARGELTYADSGRINEEASRIDQAWRGGHFNVETPDELVVRAVMIRFAANAMMSQRRYTGRIRQARQVRAGKLG